MNDIIAIRGGGDLATGVIEKFHRTGFRVVVLEVPKPTAIRRTVSLSEGVFDKIAHVEDMTAVLAENIYDCEDIWKDGNIPILIDSEACSLEKLKAFGLIDAVLAKRNLGTNPKMAPIVIALGPGFTAPKEVDAVIETMRGHNLGRVYFEGSALPNTGIPGIIGSRSAERVLRAPCAGIIEHHKKIGDLAEKGEPIFSVGKETVTAPFTGLLRGLLREGLEVFPTMKSADIDPRIDSDWRSISDKARCIGGGALEAYLHLRRGITL